MARWFRWPRWSSGFSLEHMIHRSPIDVDAPNLIYRLAFLNTAQVLHLLQCATSLQEQTCCIVDDQLYIYIYIIIILLYIFTGDWGWDVPTVSHSKYCCHNYKSIVLFLEQIYFFLFSPLIYKSALFVACLSHLRHNFGKNVALVCQKHFLFPNQWLWSKMSIKFREKLRQICDPKIHIAP